MADVVTSALANSYLQVFLTTNTGLECGMIAAKGLNDLPLTLVSTSGPLSLFQKCCQ